MLAAPKVGRAGEVGRGPPREPAGRRPVAPRARPTRRWRSTPTARSKAPGSTSSPTAAPTRRRGRSAPRRSVGMLFPGPYRVPVAGFTTKSIYTNTVGRAAYRGPWQFESLAREVLLDIAARQMGIDPVELRRRNLLRRDELPYANPNGMTYDSISPLETFEQALAMLDYEAFRAEQAEARGAGALPRGRDVELRRAVDARASATTPPRRRRSASSRRARSTSTSRAARPATASRPPWCSSTADALGVNIDDVAHDPGRHRADRASAPARPGSRSGSMTAGRDPRDGHDPARADRAPSPPTARGGGRRHRARRQPGAGAGHPLDRDLAGRARRARLLRPATRCRPGVPAGLEASARYTADTPIRSG